MFEFINEKSLKELREAEDVPKEILKGIENINEANLALAEAVATIYETILGGQA